MVKKEDFTFLSRDGVSQIHALRWVPENKPVAVLQIIHGMAEHMGRYEEVAEFFADRGILVTGEDHLGHGKSVGENGRYGYFCEQDPATVVVRDVHRLKKMTQDAYPGLPYMILGHSMGSFILRNYLFRYGSGIQGAVICATGDQPAAAIKGGLILAGLGRLLCGSGHEAKLLNKMIFGGYNKRIPAPETEFDWICTRKEVIERYEKDAACGFIFTVNGFKTLLTLIDRAGQKAKLKEIPADLPVLFIAGGQDPVGDYGAGAEKVYAGFQEAGLQKVAFKLYENDRHELLNESDRELIYRDLYDWITECIQDYEKNKKD